jgi:hypothetical protein
MHAFFKALIDSIFGMVKDLIREDKKAIDADTPKDVKDRWDRHVRDSMRDK